MSEREQIPPGTGQYSDSSAGAGPPPAGPAPTAPEYSSGPVTVRGPESLGGLLLILAGIAAGISLPLDWLADADVTGWDLMRAGFDDLGGIFDTGLWQPLAIVLGGGVLFVLGVAMWLPARKHRFLGVPALLVTGIVTAGVLVPLQEADWDLGFFGPGFWSGIAIAALGLLGALKALLTGPKRRTR